jgi:hypothetical protein
MRAGTSSRAPLGLSDGAHPASDETMHASTSNDARPVHELAAPCLGSGARRHWLGSGAQRQGTVDGYEAGGRGGVERRALVMGLIVRVERGDRFRALLIGCEQLALKDLSAS